MKLNKIVKNVILFSIVAVIVGLLNTGISIIPELSQTDSVANVGQFSKETTRDMLFSNQNSLYYGYLPSVNAFTCGDGICDTAGGEDLFECPEDCSSPAPFCGDGFCDANENSQSCPNDCQGSCIPTNGGVEICDGLDNDCDGQNDEGGVCTPTCTNQCVNGARECVGNGSRVCRDYDGDGCTEWSGVAQCGAFSQCVNGACN